LLSYVNEIIVRFVLRLGREDGQALAEYGLLLALLVVVCVLAVTALGLAISGILGGIVGAL